MYHLGAKKKVTDSPRLCCLDERYSEHVQRTKFPSEAITIIFLDGGTSPPTANVAGRETWLLTQCAAAWPGHTLTESRCGHRKGGMWRRLHTGPPTTPTQRRKTSRHFVEDVQQGGLFDRGIDRRGLSADWTVQSASEPSESSWSVGILHSTFLLMKKKEEGSAVSSARQIGEYGTCRLHPRIGIPSFAGYCVVFPGIVMHSHCMQSARLCTSPSLSSNMRKEVMDTRPAGTAEVI